jgi:hypothetical protein
MPPYRPEAGRDCTYYLQRTEAEAEAGAEAAGATGGDGERVAWLQVRAEVVKCLL